MPAEFPGATEPAEIDSDDAFAVMSAQVHGVIDAADELQDEIAAAETKLLDGDRRESGRPASGLPGLVRPPRKR